MNSRTNPNDENLVLVLVFVRTEMVVTGDPNHSEVSLNTLHSVKPEKGEQSYYNSLWQDLKLKTATVHPNQCKQRNGFAIHLFLST